MNDHAHAAEASGVARVASLEGQKRGQPGDGVGKRVWPGQVQIQSISDIRNILIAKMTVSN